jgi:hypothetical protein
LLGLQLLLHMRHRHQLLCHLHRPNGRRWRHAKHGHRLWWRLHDGLAGWRDWRGWRHWRHGHGSGVHDRRRRHRRLLRCIQWYREPRCLLLCGLLQCHDLLLKGCEQLRHGLGHGHHLIEGLQLLVRR